METKEITKTIYIANDGKEFLTEEECKEHETYVKRFCEIFPISASVAILI